MAEQLRENPHTAIQWLLNHKLRIRDYGKPELARFYTKQVFI